MTDIDIITPLSYPLKWYWSRDYVDVTIHNIEQDFLMFKYMLNIIWYGSFRITSRINPRDDIGVSGWYVMWYRKSHIIFSIYHIFQHWIKKNTINFPHRHQTYMDMSDRYRLRDDNSPVMEKVMHWSIHRKAWYRVIRFLPRYWPMGWYCCGTSGVYVWAKSI